ncbi:uncharacterized protein LOC110021852 [Phalaenopsis equestris]|uniref:uncharacterized protein LOC110021852 n=1 Tax=Phalaenopsis equestris TaxID=78828 RepID=UPI0009E5A739|nr:uncharacterized protein LOC110021852 [Phalaenopsis equestris]
MEAVVALDLFSFWQSVFDGSASMCPPRRCASLVREQRGRIYILRRCATMLLCWYIHGDE